MAQRCKNAKRSDKWLKINKSYDGVLHFALHFAFFFTCKLVLFVALGMDFMLRGVEKCIPSRGKKGLQAQEIYCIRIIFYK